MSILDRVSSYLGAGALLAVILVGLIAVLFFTR